MALPTSEKLTQLFKLLNREPGDPFLMYGLGMEYKKLGAWDEALKYFDQTIAKDSGYCYAYYQRGQTLELADKVSEAKLAYEAGIAAVNRVGEAHAASELAGALSMLE